MNNKFFELGREATMWCCENILEDSDLWDYYWERKYGELIVKECIRACVMDQADPRDSVEMKCALRIQNHFEVDHD